MIDPSTSVSDYSFFDVHQLAKWTLKIGPRVIIMGLVGYAALGWAYETGLMAAIDRFAIPILKKQVGYIGLGAVMPTFQWYAAWGVRITAALSAEALFELILLITRRCRQFFFPVNPVVSGGIPLPGMALGH